MEKDIEIIKAAYRQGGADYYYSKPYDPSVKIIGLFERRKLTDPDEIAAYKAGYENETERKDWGND